MSNGEDFQGNTSQARGGAFNVRGLDSNGTDAERLSEASEGGQHRNSQRNSVLANATSADAEAGADVTYINMLHDIGSWEDFDQSSLAGGIDSTSNMSIDRSSEHRDSMDLQADDAAQKRPARTLDDTDADLNLGTDTDAEGSTAEEQQDEPQLHSQPLSEGLQRRSRSSDTGNQFQWKLHQLLEDVAGTPDASIVSWTEDGKGFRIHQRRPFMQKISPLYFKYTKFKSFQRQLYLYDFAKFQHGVNKDAFYHKDFLRSDRSRCGLIIRKDNRKTAARIRREASRLLQAAQQTQRLLPSTVPTNSVAVLPREYRPACRRSEADAGSPHPTVRFGAVRPFESHLQSEQHASHPQSIEAAAILRADYPSRRVQLPYTAQAYRRLTAHAWQYEQSAGWNARPYRVVHPQSTATLYSYADDTDRPLFNRVLSWIGHNEAAMRSLYDAMRPDTFWPSTGSWNVLRFQDEIIEMFGSSTRSSLLAAIRPKET